MQVVVFIKVGCSVRPESGGGSDFTEQTALVFVGGGECSLKRNYLFSFRNIYCLPNRAARPWAGPFLFFYNNLVNR